MFSTSSEECTERVTDHSLISQSHRLQLRGQSAVCKNCIAGVPQSMPGADNTMIREQ